MKISLRFSSLSVSAGRVACPENKVPGTSRISLAGAPSTELEQLLRLPRLPAMAQRIEALVADETASRQPISSPN